ncbi:MAG: HNH/endonuclease VII fold putative polymorphic toxin [Hymenobacter sp.]
MEMGALMRAVNSPPLLSRNKRLQAVTALYKEAKRDAGVPRGQQPESRNKVPMTDRNGKTVLDKNGNPIMTRETTHTSTNGQKVVIQDHGAGHQFGEGGLETKADI